VTIGIGASALATALFTQAFADAGKTGDFITPLVLQKLQPVFAVLLAVILLGERVRRRYLLYAGPALFGAWLLTFPDPWHVRVHRAEVALLALAAAALWAAGTVLGRRVSAAVTSAELTTLRYVWGLVGALGVLRCEHAPMRPGAGNILGLVLLALIPGVAALRVYYAGLRRTLASRATLAELAFPGTAAVVGVLFLGSTLRASQWFGFAIVVVAITAMSAHRAGRPAADPGRALGSDVADRAGLRS
jgi:drug/metabolite transporter (DMT)-like permease